MSLSFHSVFSQFGITCIMRSVTECHLFVHYQQ